MATDPKYGRRAFFKDSVLSVAKAAKEYAAHVDAAPEKPAPPVRTDWLRPPGAVSEALFLIEDQLNELELMSPEERAYLPGTSTRLPPPLCEAM